ncbi:MAG: haloacid dehalogenase type II [Rhodospirillales bacterium]|nr:haloacid dehalogenase type II [Rhodospirillales bacterium]
MADITNSAPSFDACVFDAYGTLLDVASAATKCSDTLGDKAAPLGQLWRTKQLEYSWLRSLMGEHADFWQLTGDALDFAMETVGVDDSALRQRLMDLYFTLDAFPEVPGVLQVLKDRGIKTAILSNGSPDMLRGAIDHAGIAPLLDAVYSVEDVGIFKPHPRVYQMAVDGLDLPPEKIRFLSSNAWDVAGASYFGFRVIWVNRYGQAAERLPGGPEHVIRDLNGLVPLLGLEV